MKATKQQLDAALRDAYKLKATGPSPTADLEQYVAVIAQAVLDNEAWDRGLVIKLLRSGSVWAKARGDSAIAEITRAQADLMEGGE